MSEKKFLIVVDMQKDFVDGALGTKEAQDIVTAAAERIRECREAGYTVIATLDTHGEDYLSTREGLKLPVKHCVRGTGGWALDKTIAKELKGCAMVEKPSFGSVRLPEIIRAMTEEGDRVTVELIGLCTDICVASNALILKAFFPGADIGVRESCCAGVTPEKHRAALETMASCQIDIL